LQKRRRARRGETRMSDADVVILFHEGYKTLAFDVLVHKEYEELFKKYQEDLYDTDCPFVEEFLENHEDYVYIGSEDFAHVTGNDYIIRVINDILQTAQVNDLRVEIRYMHYKD